MINTDDKKLSGFTFIDLFAGLGGFRIALSSFGAECVFSSEWDSWAQKVYFDNFGDKPHGDITQINEKSIPNHDILCAGFPCQAFSISGKQKGFEDSRGTLFFDVARIVKEKMPKVVFMENVKNFAVHDGGNTLRVVRNTMLELGYTFAAKVVSATDFNVPQKRERIYMVCFRKDLEIDNFYFPKKIRLEKHIADILCEHDEETEKLYISRPDITMYDIADDKYMDRPIRLGIVGKGGQGQRIYSTKGIGITLSAYGGGIFAKTGGYAINGRYRKLTTRECARLMGYPDSYKICESKAQAYKQFGNSVVIDVLQHIGNEIAKSISA